MKKIQLLHEWLTVSVGILVIYLLIAQINTFNLKDKSHFSKNLFSGTHLAIKRDKEYFFTTFAHAGVLELASNIIGVPKNNSYAIDESYENINTSLETRYFKNHSLKKAGTLKEFSVYPMTDRFFFNGVQNFTKISMEDVRPTRDAWMIGATAKFLDLERKIIDVGENELVIESLIGQLPSFKTVKVYSKTKKTRSGSTRGITVSSYSDTVFWQNGVWVFDERPLLFTSRDIRHVQPGDSFLFGDGTERIVKFIRPNGVIEFHGDRLDPNLHGAGTKIFHRSVSREQNEVNKILNTSKLPNSNYISNLNRYQRILISDKANSAISINDYIMFMDGNLHKVSNIGQGYIDIDLLDHQNSGQVHLRKSQVHPLGPNTYITGNKFLHIRNDQVQLNTPNLEQAVNYKKNSLKTILENSPTIWATYTGIVNIFYDTLHPVHKNYIIHVLGSSERKKYVDDFIRVSPDYVQTSVDNFDKSSFHAWTLNTSWVFYEQLLLNYLPIFNYDYMIMWQRKSENWIEHSAASSIQMKNSFPTILPAFEKKSGCDFELYTVTIDYEVINPWKSIPVIGRTDRYLINKKGAENSLPVSIPPEERKWSFPVLRRVGFPVELTIDEIHPITKFSKITVKGIDAKKLSSDKDLINKMFFPPYYGDEAICGRKPISISSKNVIN